MKVLEQPCALAGHQAFSGAVNGEHSAWLLLTRSHIVYYDCCYLTKKYQKMNCFQMSSAGIIMATRKQNEERGMIYSQYPYSFECIEVGNYLEALDYCTKGIICISVIL